MGRYPALGRVNSLDYLNGKEIDPDRKRDAHPFLPRYARDKVRQFEKKKNSMK